MAEDSEAKLPAPKKIIQSKKNKAPDGILHFFFLRTHHFFLKNFWLNAQNFIQKKITVLLDDGPPTQGPEEPVMGWMTPFFRLGAGGSVTSSLRMKFQ